MTADELDALIAEREKARAEYVRAVELNIAAQDGYIQALRDVRAKMEAVDDVDVRD